MDTVPQSETVFVTGAAGFIAGHTCERLLREGHTVIGVDNFSPYYDPAIKRRTQKLLSRHPRMHFFEINILDRPRLTELFEQFKPTSIIHLAAQAGVRYSLEHIAENIQVNIVGTTNILECARDFKISNIVAASSSSVYGEGSTAPYDESQRCDMPISPYAATKRSCELFGYTFHHLFKMDITMLRFFTVYGPRGRPDMAAFKFIDRIHRGTPIERYGDGSAVREFTYIDDIVNGVITSLHTPNGFRAVNLGGGCTYTVNEFIAEIENVVGKRAIIHEKAPFPGDVFLTSADQTTAKELLGFEPTTSLRDGLRSTYAWYLSSLTESDDGTEATERGDIADENAELSEESARLCLPPSAKLERGWFSVDGDNDTTVLSGGSSVPSDGEEAESAPVVAG